MSSPTSFQVFEFIKGIIMPFVSLKQVVSTEYPLNPKTNAAVASLYALVYLARIGSFVSCWAYPGLSGVTTTLFVMSGSMLSMVRSEFRAIPTT
jgi:hypothetical protein